MPQAVSDVARQAVNDLFDQRLGAVGIDVDNGGHGITSNGAYALYWGLKLYSEAGLCLSLYRA
ncbi:hypothetical protein [Paludibacterium denitrificans]|uniref:Uncharacterized protein n=1 Tax=Paludibacterium denitrificans TaxID=2675226 RepID=A0A844GC51_9NEIS|nr:hypothetical protein [Paludibacterium denitrificans]MTD32354.1 hypothetical protein [Paludibacterium denitrificans]